MPSPAYFTPVGFGGRYPRMRWIFFDVGGVLVNEEATLKHFASTIQGLLAGHGIRVPVEKIERIQLEAARGFGSVTRAVISSLTPDKGIGNKVYGDLWRKARNLDEPYPEAVEVLRRLSSAYGLGVIANQLPGSRERLRRFGFTKYLSVYALSDELQVSKPDDAIFSYALKAANCMPSEAVMVGDRVDNDIIPAKRLGMRSVRVLRGIFVNQKASGADELPDAEIRSLTELIGIDLLK
ncbi:MAG: HAD family hydrolase [Candidatus Brockarchaeota archaeon]|nr:HAD family hydrolase [Candidatus Brockarchaeota archaeon]